MRLGNVIFVEIMEVAWQLLDCLNLLDRVGRTLGHACGALPCAHDY